MRKPYATPQLIKWLKTGPFEDSPFMKEMEKSGDTFNSEFKYIEVGDDYKRRSSPLVIVTRVFPE